MAEHRELEYATATGNDYDEHEKMYRRFIVLLKWHIYIIAAILVLMAYFLV